MLKRAPLANTHSQKLDLFEVYNFMLKLLRRNRNLTQLSKCIYLKVYYAWIDLTTVFSILVLKTTLNQFIENEIR